MRAILELPVEHVSLEDWKVRITSKGAFIASSMRGEQLAKLQVFL
ncbi:MAG: hypothetical protein ACYYK0_00165 [Candidatus Eutrophobiaceae bacterium]